MFLANDRCHQENLIGQLKGGLKALAMPVVGEASCGEAFPLADGVQHVLRSGDPDSMPDRADIPPDRVPLAVVEPVARRLSEAGGAVAPSTVVLSAEGDEAGVRMPRSTLTTNRREVVC